MRALDDAVGEHPLRAPAPHIGGDLDLGVDERPDPGVRPPTLDLEFGSEADSHVISFLETLGAGNSVMAILSLRDAEVENGRRHLSSRSGAPARLDRGDARLELAAMAAQLRELARGEAEQPGTLDRQWPRRATAVVGPAPLVGGEPLEVRSSERHDVGRAAHDRIRWRDFWRDCVRASGGECARVRNAKLLYCTDEAECARVAG